jgi:hypothetical protein
MNYTIETITFKFDEEISLKIDLIGIAQVLKRHNIRAKRTNVFLKE